MSPTPAPTRSRSRAQAVELRRVTILVATIALALATLFVPREASAATAHRARITSATTASYARAMLALLNQERRAHGRSPLTMAWRLRESAHRHNLRMARANVMSHQLPGEAYITTRISNTGYRWRMIGENVGWNSNISSAGILALERMMYHEAPPGDTGHRQNILNRGFRQVGIDVYYDACHHRLWFTQDFGAPA